MKLKRPNKLKSADRDSAEEAASMRHRQRAELEELADLHTKSPPNCLTMGDLPAETRLAAQSPKIFGLAGGRLHRQLIGLRAHAHYSLAGLG